MSIIPSVLRPWIAGDGLCPEVAPDWSYWFGLPEWSVWEASFLLLGWIPPPEDDPRYGVSFPGHPVEVREAAEALAKRAQHRFQDRGGHRGQVDEQQIERIAKAYRRGRRSRHSQAPSDQGAHSTGRTARIPTAPTRLLGASPSSWAMWAMKQKIRLPPGMEGHLPPSMWKLLADVRRQAPQKTDLSGQPAVPFPEVAEGSLAREEQSMNTENGPADVELWAHIQQWRQALRLDKWEITAACDAILSGYPDALFRKLERKHPGGWQELCKLASSAIDDQMLASHREKTPIYSSGSRSYREQRALSDSIIGYWPTIYVFPQSPPDDNKSMAFIPWVKSENYTIPPGLLRALDDKQKTLPWGEPFDENFRRLRYCRYADDFIFGIIGSKDEAREIMQKVEHFIVNTLKLQVAPEKTGIHSGKEGITFLSYRISTYRSDKVVRTKNHGRYIRQRTINDRIRLDIPNGKAQKFCQRYDYGDWDQMKPTHRGKLAVLSDEEIICTYNAELRGLANYYCLAKGVKYYLNRLEFMSRYSLFKTFARKYKTTVSKVAAKFRKGNEFIQDYEVKGKKYQMKVFKLAHMDVRPKDWQVDVIPNTLQLVSPRSELVKRLNYSKCEYCGNTEPPFESHHVRKVKDLNKKKYLARWEWLMVTRNRKTLVLCRKCHKDLHRGTLPDSRYQGNT